MIALVVTIIVLLILAAVAINLTIGDNGIFTRAQNATEKYEIAQEKEWITEAVYAAKIETKGGNIADFQLKKELDNIVGKDKTMVDTENSDLIVTFVENERKYKVDQKGSIEDYTPEIIDSTPGELEGKGDEKDPYKISSIEDLIAFSNIVNEGYSYKNEYLVLERDLDFHSESSYTNPNDTNLFGDYNDDGIIEGIKNEVTKENFCGFKMIGKYPQLPFEGVLDGKGHMIKNIYIYSADDVSMFGYNNGEIKNMHLKDGYVLGESSYISGLVTINNGLIDSCSTELIIQAKYDTPLDYSTYAAGIAVENDNVNATIKNCVNKSNIITPYTCMVGGIVKANEGNIDGCINYGKIQGTTNYIETYTKCTGGIASDNRGTIKNCINNGEVSGYEQVGGIVGCSTEGIVTKCINKRKYKRRRGYWRNFRKGFSYRRLIKLW